MFLTLGRLWALIGRKKIGKSENCKHMVCFTTVQVFFSLSCQTWEESRYAEDIIILNSRPHSEQDVVLLTPNYFSLFPLVTHWMNFCSPLGSCQFSRHSMGTSGQNVSSPSQWRVLLRLGPASNYPKGIIKVSFSIKARHTILQTTPPSLLLLSPSSLSLSLSFSAARPRRHTEATDFCDSAPVHLLCVNDKCSNVEKRDKEKLRVTQSGRLSVNVTEM